ncbi:MAG: RloB domain-containing protein, partial [Burkholderiales bacterium]|nr:RloB domain-containing protein [Phycisphaerae bacterium]
GGECGAAAVSVVGDAVRRIRARRRSVLAKYDEVWCVIDVEAHGKNPNLTHAIEQARQAEIQVALSNPCFEVWILWHFSPKCSPFLNCASVVHFLRKAYPKYSKAHDCFADLYPNTLTACTIAERQNSLFNGKTGNPTSAVYKIVKLLHEIVEVPIPLPSPSGRKKQKNRRNN